MAHKNGKKAKPAKIFKKAMPIKLQYDTTQKWNIKKESWTVLVKLYRSNTFDKGSTSHHFSSGRYPLLTRFCS